jgi:OOP family OmpA-OmpF porin
VPEPIQKEPIVLQGVNFEFDSAKLTPEAETNLNGVIEALKASPETKTLIKGHTCNIGTSEYNLGLSNRRADSVKAYLTEGGVAADSMSTRGYGEASPITTNDTKEGREQNRRVELQVLDADTCVPPAVGDQVDEKGCATLP